MPSGGGGGGTKMKLPGYMEDYSKDILHMQANQAYKPYEAYTGQQQADLDPYRTQAWGQIAGMQGQGDPAFQASEAAYGGLLGSAAPITAQQVGDTTSQFMNPYNANVLDVAQQRFTDQANTQQGLIGGQAANVGAFGGDRQGVIEGTMRAQAAKNMGDLTANVQQQGYNQALQSAMGMLQGNQAAGMTAAQMLPQVAAAQQQYGLTDAQALAAAGNARQGYQQQGLDIAHQEWLQKQGYNQQQIDAFARTLAQMPGGAGTTSVGGGAGGVMGGLKGAAGGAATGAAVGSVFPGYGTAVGAGVGAVAGGLMGGL